MLKLLPATVVVSVARLYLGTLKRLPIYSKGFRRAQTASGLEATALGGAAMRDLRPIESTRHMHFLLRPKIFSQCLVKIALLLLSVAFAALYASNAFAFVYTQDGFSAFGGFACNDGGGSSVTLGGNLTLTLTTMTSTSAFLQLGGGVTRDFSGCFNQVQTDTWGWSLTRNGNHLTVNAPYPADTYVWDLTLGSGGQSISGTFNDYIHNTVGDGYAVGIASLLMTPLSQAKLFYDDVAIRTSDAIHKISFALLAKAASESASALALEELDPAAAESLFEQQAEDLELAKELNDAPSAEEIPPFVDPPLPLPLLSPGGVISQTMANQFQQLGQYEFEEAALGADLVGLTSQIGNVLQGGDLATSLISTYVYDRGLLNRLSLQSAGLYGDLQSEFGMVGFDFGIKNSDIQSYVDSVASNGFPPAEGPLLTDLGLDPLAMGNLLTTADLSKAPTTLGGLLSLGASIQTQLADATQSVPEPSTIALFGLGLAGLGFSRRRKRA